jgi:hypothetical protein
MMCTAVFNSAAYSQAVQKIAFVNGRISKTFKDTGTQTFSFKVTGGEKECSIKITSKGKAAKARLTNKAGHDFVEEQDKTDVWATLKNGEYWLKITAPKGVSYTVKLEVYKLEQS